jgi:hypothetical protein
VLNGVTLMAQPSPLDQVIRANLKFHRAVFTRLNVAFHIASANAEAQAASKLLASGSLNPQAYLAFLNQQSGPMGSIIAELIKSQRSADTFAANQALKVLQGALATQKEDLVANDHLSLLNKLDAFQTMLQKAQGDPSDILQMVVWQRRLYSTAPKLMQLKFSKHVVEESDEFINNYGRPKAKGDSYTELLRELLGAFHDTAEALECPDKRLEAAVAHLKDSFGSLEQLEKAHRAYLLELQDAVK